MRRLAPNTHFMLVARNPDRLTAVAQDLLTRGALAAETWVMDLDNTSAHAEMLATAAEAGTKLTFGEIAERNLSNAVDAGMGEQDWSAIYELARKKAGLD